MPTPPPTTEEVVLLRQENAVLRAQIAWLKQKLFGGGKSETLEQAQLRLQIEELEQAIQERPCETIQYERKKGPSAPRTPPAETFAHLPIVETIEIIPEPVKRDPDLYEKIGEERTFEVDVIEPKLVRREIVRLKYRHRLNRAVPPLLSAAPARVIQGGYASSGLLAWIVVNKYVHHLPLYRLEQMSQRWGAKISRSTMCEWVEVTANCLEPIYRKMHQELLAGNYLQADETPIRCNDPDEKRGGTTQGYLWVISRPGADVVFDWKLSRRHEELTSLLKDFKGVLQSDAYGAYLSHAREKVDVTRVACWAHARRYFLEAAEQNARAVHLVLKLIARLYHYEKTWDLAEVGELRAQLRREHFAYPLRWIKRLALGLQKKTLPSSPIGKACAYLLNQWDAFVVHQDYSHTRLDNNLVENAIRPSAIGKKNWLFIGHPDAGQRSAVIYSLVVSCQRHGKDPLSYLRDVLKRLPAMSNQDDLQPLLPANWQLSPK